MKHSKILILILITALLLPSAVACRAQKEPQSVTYYEYFDTVSAVRSYAGDSKKEFEKNCAFIEKELEDYHRLFDIYREYSGINNLCTVNKNAGVAPVKVDEKLIDLLLYCKEIYTLTGGEVNIAMGAVLSLWHGCRENEDSPQLPDAEALMAATEHISIECIVIDRESSAVYISDSEASIDVGAVAKGYATERIAEKLHQKGIGSYVLDIGGNIRTVGTKPDGSGWITGIKNPDTLSAEPYAARITLSKCSCVTSGSYERYFTVDEKSYHHIIDKDTLYPAEHFISVTVITPDSGLADALSTALFCMTYEEGLALVGRLENVEVLWIRHGGEQLATEGFSKIRL